MGRYLSRERADIRFCRDEEDHQALYIPLSGQALKWLPEKGESTSDGYVFGNLVNYGNVNENLKKWVEATGIRKHISYHTSRHNFATMMLTLGADLYTTSKLLGHSNVKTA